eukprot:1143050-Pelagomonas_calceolata.AAC.3
MLPAACGVPALACWHPPSRTEREPSSVRCPKCTPCSLKSAALACIHTLPLLALAMRYWAYCTHPDVCNFGHR